MKTPARTSVKFSIVNGPVRTELRLSADELAAAAEISPTMLARLVRLGLIEPAAEGSTEFTAASARRLRRMLRLRRDLGVNLTGAAILVDLLERLEQLEAELACLRGSR